MNQIQRAKPVTERTIFQRLSAEFSAAFPPEAEAFLMKNGRGCPDRHVFRAKGREYHLSRFLSASAADELNLYSAAVMLQEDTPEPLMLPFAENGFGDYYCLGFEGGKPVGVLFWDHEEGTADLLFEQFSELLQAMDLAE